jgi:hypothetical protein
MYQHLIFMNFYSLSGITVSRNQIKDDMGGACSTHGASEKYVQDFS